MIDLTYSEFIDSLRSAVTLDAPYLSRAHQPRFLKEPTASTAPAAVLLLFGFNREGHSHLLFIRRTESVQTHKGQMAFPGGLCEDDDCSDPIATALRETEEEIGFSRKNIEVLGQLPVLITVTGYSICPVVGILTAPLEEVPFVLNPEETAEALWVPLKVLISPGVYRHEFIHARSPIDGQDEEIKYEIDVYQVDQYRIWGATGSMTKNMLDRLKPPVKLQVKSPVKSPN